MAIYKILDNWTKKIEPIAQYNFAIESAELRELGICKDTHTWLYIRYKSMLLSLYRYSVEELDDFSSIRIYGPSISGKDFWVNVVLGQSLYNKRLNKWWDGFKNEEKNVKWYRTSAGLGYN